jgi:hypothetical protein
VREALPTVPSPEKPPVPNEEPPEKNPPVTDPPPDPKTGPKAIDPDDAQIEPPTQEEGKSGRSTSPNVDTGRLDRTSIKQARKERFDFPVVVSIRVR